MRAYYLNRDGKCASLSSSRNHSSGREEAIGCNKNFTGPAQEVVESSSSARINNIGWLGQYEYLREEVKAAEKIFIRNFYTVLKGMHNTIDVNWVTACKERQKELFEVYSSIVQEPDHIAIVIMTKNGKILSLDDLKYAPKSYRVMGADTINETILDVYISKKEPKIFAPLFVAMFKVALACQETRDSEPYLFSELKSLAFSLYERAGLYNETNPDDREWRKQEDQSLEILTSKPTRKERRWVKKAFEQVKSDIKEGVKLLKRSRGRAQLKPYISEICNAIFVTEKFCHSAYSEDDYYLSMAADAARVKELSKLGIHASLLKSALETDPLVGCEFDKHVGFVSHYNKGETTQPWVVTMQIPNPGKFKTRAIHLGLAAIQDRCAYIHRRLAAVLAKIPSDCTALQEKGITFTLKISDPNWRENNSWPSVLAFDWSNATDKLWSWFQEECLSIIFDKEVVEFWHQVSTCKKEFRHKDGSITPYTQVNGQPQGLLGSFEAFAFAHHIMMLMVMKLSHLEIYKGSDFYRVLGDDSVICSIIQDRRNRVGSFYRAVCDWCNVPVNVVKSTQILWDNHVALVEFAKIHALNGEYFSPIPERLANRIGMHNQDYYAFSGAFWGMRHGMDNQAMVENLIDRYYPDETDNKLARIMLFSGIIPSYNDIGFNIDVTLGETEEAYQIALCYWYNKIRSSFAMSIMSDKVKELLTYEDKELKDAVQELIPEDLSFLLDRIEDPDHKLLYAIQTNIDKRDTIESFINCSGDQALVIAATVKLTSEELEGVREVLNMYNDVLVNPARIDWYHSEIRKLGDKLKSLDRLNYRSIYKRDSRNSMILRSTLKTYRKIFLQSSLKA